MYNKTSNFRTQISERLCLKYLTSKITKILKNLIYKYQKFKRDKTFSVKMAFILQKLLIIFLLFTSAFTYLQFKLVRVPHKTKVYDYGIVQCLTDIPKKAKKTKSKDDNEDERRMLTKKVKKDEDQDQDDQDEIDKQDQEEMQQEENKQVTDQDNFKEICYQKDISYSIELFNKNKELMLLSIDLTVPISWVKGQKCFITQTHRKCNRIQTNYRQQMASLTKKFKQLLKKPFKPKQKSKSKDGQYGLIEGSSQVVKGVLQKTQTLEFMTRDSGRLTRFADLMLLGMFILDINANLNLKDTTFINATQISPALNYLCDGAISLRFDQNSESSFLKEMTAVAQSQESFVTIFIGQHNQSMTIGDLSVKNAAHGLSGLRWIPVSQDQQYGKLPRCQSITLTESNSELNKFVTIKLPLVLTLSSSTITIPKDSLQKIFTKFFPKKKCTINQTTRYIQCEKISPSQLQQKQLNFISNQTAIMIPFKKLILDEKKHKITFNIKSSLDQKYIILGQPLFKMYFVVLDYKNDKIGLALQRTKFADALFDAVSLIRFVVWAFILGTCSICLLLPAQKCYTKIINRLVTANTKSKTKKKNFPGTKDQKTKINTYTEVQQQSGFEDLRGKIQQITDDEARGL